MESHSTAPDTDERLTIFLSYARADRQRAEKLAHALDLAGFEVWWDALIEGGAAFANSIREALDAADAVIVLWSRSSIDSDWVRDEAAQGRDRRRLVPLSLDGSEPPLGFRQYHAIDLRKWRGKADAPEMVMVARAIAAATGQPRPSVRSSAKPISRRSVLWIGSGAAAVVVGGGGLYLLEHGI
jgi:hypothetical protein